MDRATRGDHHVIMETETGVMQQQGNREEARKKQEQICSDSQGA